ncbi:unnamed protein product [Caenorhabditis angaria]|uniref:Uncharacterized protein n=1 Tax=Caenorhabditis angaria TaxID=860376 RepID=A0A9P1IRK4_9PELO|nr:unnamed protein product [Caenorhabditis angaria]
MNNDSTHYGSVIRAHFKKLYIPSDSARPPIAKIKSEGKKWIVVTSISHPTDDVKRLASFKDWNLVVVADTKTPIDWKLDDVHFLSVDYQNSMAFDVISFLPYKSYTRKNIGYLYAISYGAEWIYDTDDDNKPYGLGLQQFQYDNEISGLRYVALENENVTSHKLFNPYRFFGLDEMWPRGFPLEYIKEHTNGKNRQVLCSKMPRSAVQQGLVHHDPDVDAIYRLLNAEPAGLNERFNKFAPSILLEPGTYAPWNSQNTLFHKSAFHVLMLPTTVSFRTTDIWRSFFAQKILHLSGHTISFTPVNAVQFRNSHDFLKDFENERQVYEDSGKIIRFLDSWSCSNSTLIECMRKLADDFVVNDFWQQNDAALIDYYIADLQKIGYEFPEVLNPSSENPYLASKNETRRDINCRRANFEFDLTYPDNSTEPAIQKAEQKIENFGVISKWCGEAGFKNFTNHFLSPEELAQRHSKDYVLKNNMNNVLLVVNNYPWKWAIGHIQRLYQPYFASVVFCGSYYPENYTKTDKGYAGIQEPFNFIHINPAEILRGYFGYHCLTLLNDVGLQNVHGYYFMADDAHFNIWQRIDFKRVHHLMGVEFMNSNQWWVNKLYGINAAKTILAKMSNTTNPREIKTWKTFEGGLRKYGYIKPNETVATDLLNGKSRSISDFFYVPSSEIQYYSELMRIFYDGQLFLELAVNRYLRSVRHQTSNFGTKSYLWGDRGSWATKYSVDMVAMHPIKLSGFMKPDKNRLKYCASCMKPWHDILFGASTNFTVKVDNAKDHMNG